MSLRKNIIGAVAASFVILGGVTSWACGVVTAPAAVAVNTAPPVITGSLVVGSTLSVTNGAWTNNPTSFTYQWFWDDTGAPIAGATSSTYAVKSTDIGHSIHATVTAINAGGSSIPCPGLCPL